MNEEQQRANYRNTMRSMATVLAQHAAIARQMQTIYFTRGYGNDPAMSDLGPMVTMCEQLTKLLGGQATTAAQYQVTLDLFRTDI
jgi:hypothetical protein